MAQLQNRQFNIVIVGQGLAGSLLAWKMIQQDLSVLVIDNNHQHSASKVAAGIINPITGHRSNLTNRFVEFISEAKSTYQQLQTMLGETFLSPIEQQRLLKNHGQHSYYLKRLQQDEYSDFVSALQSTEAESMPFKSFEFGVATIKETFRVDTKLLLAALKAWLIEQNSYHSEKVDYADIVVGKGSVGIKTSSLDCSAEHLVFCEGYQAMHNPWFKNLPFKLAKGEILTLQLEQQQTAMLNWGHWLLPVQFDEKIALLGANYVWHDTSETCNAAVAEELQNSLKEYTHISGKTIDHQSGIRPATINRKPLIGLHPQQPRLSCFNGFGSKGCLIIPHYAELFAQYFSQGIALKEHMPEIDPIDFGQY